MSTHPDGHSQRYFTLKNGIKKKHCQTSELGVNAFKPCKSPFYFQFNRIDNNNTGHMEMKLKFSLCKVVGQSVVFSVWQVKMWFSIKLHSR